MKELVGPAWTLSPEKRLNDLAGVSLLMPGLLPACAFTGATIHAVDHMPPIYASERYGLGLTAFTMYKFRTMPEATPLTPSSGSSADPRATQLGRKLRGMHIDELPNAINVLKGDMSLFGGPRALIWEDVERTFDVLTPSEQKEWRESRSVARPSVFGLFQLEQHVKGYMTDDVYRARAMSDIRYAREASFRLDMSIAARSVYHGLRTPNSLVYGKGANFLGVVAKSMGVDVAPTDLEYWRTLFKVARAFDDETDNKHAEDVEKYFDKLTKGAPTFTIGRSEAKKFAAMYRVQTSERRAQIRNVFVTLPIYAERKRLATSVAELGVVNQEESRGFAELLFLEPVGSDARQRARMNEWLLRFASAGYAVDALTDLKDDYLSMNVSVRPTLGNHLLLARAAVGKAAEGLKATPLAAVTSVAHVAFLNTLKRL